MEEKKTDTNLKRNRTAGSGKYTYKYVDIAQIHQYLEENNMSYYQYIDRIDKDDYIMTVKIIDGKEQNPLRGCRVVDATLVGINNPAQQQGSALTFARRYSLLMAFGLATEDDDAQNLSKQTDEITTIEQAQNYVISFGKHKGKNLKEITQNETDYANWLLQNGDETVKKCLNIILKNKNKIKNEEKGDK